MTYCVAMLLDAGLVFLADSRTSAGVDQISTFRKTTVFERPGERVLFLMRDTIDFAAAWLGAVRAGAVAVALNNKLNDADIAHVVGIVERVVGEQRELMRAPPTQVQVEEIRDNKVWISVSGVSASPSAASCVVLANSLSAFSLPSIAMDSS